jgi:hypothetical protein
MLLILRHSLVVVLAGERGVTTARIWNRTCGALDAAGWVQSQGAPRAFMTSWLLSGGRDDLGVVAGAAVNFRLVT